MSRRAAVLPDGVRMSDLLSVMVLARIFPMDAVNSVLVQTGKASVRERSLPAPFMVYYVMALWLWRSASCQEVLRCVFEAFNLANRREGEGAPVSACKAAIAQARARIGEQPLALLCERFARPIATEDTRGAYWRGWRLTSLDGSTLNVADSQANSNEFGRPGSSRSADGGAFPQIRFCSLVENGTHALFGAALGAYTTGELTLAQSVVSHLKEDMLCLADRNFFGYPLWTKAAQTGAALVWRVRSGNVLPIDTRLSDGSYLSHVYPSPKDRRRGTNGVPVRVVDYSLLAGADPEGETIYRLITTILDHERAPAEELAALYAQRWEIETTLDEFKTHMGGRDLVLRSKTPEGVRQEFWGFILAHHAVRALMHEAATKADVAATRLSFTHAVNEVRRKMPMFLVVPPSEVQNTV